MNMERQTIPFTKQMRKATREIHSVSDALINAKLATALSNNMVWADGLLIFYEIFRYLEEAMLRLKDTSVGDLKFDGMRRTEAFERDLKYYLGENWADNYTPRDSVVKYLLHLRDLERKDPDLLMAYIYHLYMGLLSGGQILRKKRTVMKTLFPFFSSNSGGNDVTDFGGNIPELKKQFANAMNIIAESLSDDKRIMLIEESKMVFVLNNEMVRTVSGTTQILIKKIIVLSVIILILCILFKYLLTWYF